LIAAFDLPSGPEKRGRRAKDWYHSFAVLLLRIAKNAGISPTLYKDREAEHESPKGWLLDAARELETFLPTAMRSPSDVARYKRERALITAGSFLLALMGAEAPPTRISGLSLAKMDRSSPIYTATNLISARFKAPQFR
jgi:hypothetical protein